MEPAPLTSPASPLASAAYVLLVPSLTANAGYAAAHAAQFPATTADNVHIVIHGSPDTTAFVKDTTLAATPGAERALMLPVGVVVNGVQFSVRMDYLSGDSVRYRGRGLAQSYPVTEPTSVPSFIAIDYVGTGARIASIAVSPATFTLSGADATIALAAVAKDSTGASTATPVAWTSSDTTIATVSGTGLVRARSKAGTVTISVTAPNGAVGSAAGTVGPAASAIRSRARERSGRRPPS